MNFRVLYDFVTGGSLLTRALLLAALTLALKVPLGLVGAVVADRQRDCVRDRDIQRLF